MKQHKTFTIEYDIEDSCVQDVSYKGSIQELTAAILAESKKLIDAAVNAVLIFYISHPEKDAFLSKFFLEAAKYDDYIVPVAPLQSDKKQTKAN